MNAARASWRPWALVGLAAVLGAASGCSAWRMGQSAKLLRASEPYQSSPSEPSATLLVVGDSTAVGTGASIPERSVPGLLGTAHPRLKVVNRARDGAKWRDFAEQLEAERGRFDAVLVIGGGNDVIRATPSQRLQEDVRRVAALARERSERVILLPPGNVGNAPFFWRVTAPWMSHRSRQLHDAVRTAAAATGATYVNLYRPRETDPFALRPDELHAADGLHPSDAGYRLWLTEVQKQAGGEKLAWLGR
jgi:lysophospholipase L1-like esterase